jgi:hypothetical protein
LLYSVIQKKHFSLSFLKLNEKGKKNIACPTNSSVENC